MGKGLVGLGAFERFDIEGFLKGKTFEACDEAKVLTDFSSGEVLGVRITVEIVGDRTDPSGEISNVGARFDLKIIGKEVSDYEWVGYRVPVEIVNVSGATRWAMRQGGARNQLTVTGDVRKPKARE